MTSTEDPSNWSDSTLVSGCAAGDGAAWRELLARYGPMIYGISRRFRLSPEDCVDVFGQVCKILLENLHCIKSADRLAGYISTTTRRACLAVVRDHQRHQRLSGLLSPGDLETSGTETEADAIAMTALRGNMIQRSMEHQDPRCRELLWLLFFDETEPDYQEISKRLKMPVASIGPTRSRCLEKFRKTLERMGFNE